MSSGSSRFPIECAAHHSCGTIESVLDARDRAAESARDLAVRLAQHVPVDERFAIDRVEQGQGAEEAERAIWRPACHGTIDFRCVGGRDRCAPTSPANKPKAEGGAKPVAAWKTRVAAVAGGEGYSQPR